MEKSLRIMNFIKGIEQINPKTSVKGSIEVVGDNRVIVEKADSILEYTDSSIRLDMSGKTVVITGAFLGLYDYSERNIVIDGKIKSISFE